MRENFSTKTKENLARRVAYRCSFPGCGRITIGAGHKNSSDVVNLGEEAHINAASPQGPRFDPLMTFDQRTSIDNGIWMCRSHAKLIDADFHNYSALTIKQWKKIAEEKTFDLLETLEKEKVEIPTTFISIGHNIVFEGVWSSANENIWEFNVKNFVIGNMDLLKKFNEEVTVDSLRYIVIESQGDGRFIYGNLNWKIEEDKYKISLTPKEKSPRTTPYNMSDISANFEFENGDIKIVKGEDCAKQTIQIALSLDFGELFYAPSFGSFSSHYYWQFKENPEILKRLLKLEITRLISIPYLDSSSGRATPPLDFINRVLDIDFGNLNLSGNKLPIKLKLEWGDGKIWEDTLSIFIHPKK